MVSEWPQSESSLTRLDDVCRLLLFSAIAAVALRQALSASRRPVGKGGLGRVQVAATGLAVGWLAVRAGMVGFGVRLVEESQGLGSPNQSLTPRVQGRCSLKVRALVAWVQWALLGWQDVRSGAIPTG